MKDISKIIELLQCPQCQSDKLTITANLDKLLCKACETEYPVIHGRPVLLRPDNALFSLDDYLDASPSATDTSYNSINTLIPSPSVNLASTRVLARMRQLLTKRSSSIILVVGGGNQQKWLNECLGVHKDGNLQVVYSDIDIAAEVDLFCDGHDLPFKDGVFDAVITTAVLEHVLYPEQVASEIRRLLKVDGLLYSEIPFMQQVHEGAYDFTRYTLSGHRRLFNGFAEIEGGMVAGPGTALVWSIENFMLAFISKSILRKICKATVRIGFFWLKYLDYLLINRPEAMDGASCTYFFGKKIETCVSDREIVDGYIGAKYLTHT